MKKPPHYETMDYELNGHKIYIKKLKLYTALKSKYKQKVINIYDGNIAKRTGNNKWQVLLLDTGNRYRWFKSDWGDSEYLDNSQYLPLPPPSEQGRQGE